MIAKSSLINLEEHKASGKLGLQANNILTFFKSNPHRDFSRAEVSELLNIRLSSVCGRINELLEKGHLESQLQRKCRITNKTVSPVKLVPQVYKVQLRLL
jgi:hypothetical protein